MGRDTVPVPRQTPRLPDPAELVRRRLAYERQVRDWSTPEVARRLTDSGFKISQSSVWSIESDPRRKVTFTEAVAFADLYGLKLGELLQPPVDVSTREVLAFMQEIVTFRRDARALLSRLTDLLDRVGEYNSNPVPEALDVLADYLGISKMGAPTDKLKKDLARAADVARELAETLPDEAISITFRQDGGPDESDRETGQ